MADDDTGDEDDDDEEDDEDDDDDADKDPPDSGPTLFAGPVADSDLTFGTAVTVRTRGKRMSKIAGIPPLVSGTRVRPIASSR